MYTIVRFCTVSYVFLCILTVIYDFLRFIKSFELVPKIETCKRKKMYENVKK